MVLSYFILKKTQQRTFKICLFFLKMMCLLIKKMKYKLCPEFTFFFFFFPKTPFHILQLSTNCIINNPNILTGFFVFLFSERNELCCTARVSNLGWNAVRAILIHVCWCSLVSLERCFVLIMIMTEKAAFTFCALKLDLSGFVCSKDLRFIS